MTRHGKYVAETSEVITSLMLQRHAPHIRHESIHPGGCSWKMKRWTRRGEDTISRKTVEVARSDGRLWLSLHPKKKLLQEWAGAPGSAFIKQPHWSSNKLVQFKKRDHCIHALWKAADTKTKPRRNLRYKQQQRSPPGFSPSCYTFIKRGRTIKRWQKKKKNVEQSRWPKSSKGACLHSSRSGEIKTRPSPVLVSTCSLKIQQSHGGLKNFKQFIPKTRIRARSPAAALTPGLWSALSSRPKRPPPCRGEAEVSRPGEGGWRGGLRPAWGAAAPAASAAAASGTPSPAAPGGWMEEGDSLWDVQGTWERL